MKAFDITPIIANFYRDILEPDQRSNWEAYLLIAIPGLLSLVALARPIDNEFITMMMTALAILFGFTFNSLLTTAKYSPKDDPVEERVVNQTRLGTAYALLVNLATLITIVTISIAVADYGVLTSAVSTTISYGLYFLLFHYLLVMVYLMRYLYLLVIGGALELSPEPESPPQDGQQVNQPESTGQSH